MLPKQHRLPLRPGFTRLRQQGTMVSGNYFSLLFTKNNKDSQPLFAFIVSKKIDKRAAVRNRVRRLLSESVRNALPHISPGVEGVFLTKKTIVEKSLEEIKGDIESVFLRAQLLR